MRIVVGTVGQANEDIRQEVVVLKVGAGRYGCMWMQPCRGEITPDLILRACGSWKGSIDHNPTTPRDCLGQFGEVGLALAALGPDGAGGEGAHLRLEQAGVRAHTFHPRALMIC